MIFTELSINDRRDIIDFVSSRTGYAGAIIEKDWWVTTVLRAIFSLPYASSLSFKGGTSLSKCWRLINRMSEDIDIAINREYLGFAEPLSKTQISDKLRRATCSFVRQTMQSDINDGLLAQGIDPRLFKVWVNITPVSTTDPEVIFIEYNPTVPQLAYIPPRVKIEVSGRSMTEAVIPQKVSSYIAETISSEVLTEDPVELTAVSPHRTFLEKIFLLHESLAKPPAEIRVERMSRHIYDIDQIMDTHIAEEAINDSDLYDSIIEHRRKFIGLKGFDYDTLRRGSINIIPDEKILRAWQLDYQQTISNMVLGNTRRFDEVLVRMKELNKKINGI
ncbi:MAG: nucleotidyl transferase AbiEii/AbiGii toxin family protein [Paramuribaculum sp.]|nr:nucleotidyl transferase AbiEii/AbiGii toxin family protein [Paramuribaculum sp.]